MSVVGREFDLGKLAERGVDRAGVLLRFGHRDALVVVLDAETGELVKVPGLPRGAVRNAPDPASAGNSHAVRAHHVHTTRSGRLPLLDHGVGWLMPVVPLMSAVDVEVAAGWPGAR